MYRWAAFFPAGPGTASMGGGLCCAVKRALVLADALMVPELQRRAWLVADVPSGAKQRLDYGVALQKEGRWEEAEEQYKSALRFNPADPKSQMNLAVVLTAQAKLMRPRRTWKRRCVSANNGEFHFNYASLLQRLGRGMKPDLTTKQRRVSCQIAGAHYNHALSCFRRKRK